MSGMPPCRVGKGAERAVPTSSLSEGTPHIIDVATPVRRQRAARHVLMEAAVRPIAYARNKPMFDRIEVNVIDIARQIRVQQRRCQIPFSRLPILLGERHAALERSRENPLLIRFQRKGKSAFCGGSDQIACKWSGRTQMAIVSNGYRF